MMNEQKFERIKQLIQDSAKEVVDSDGVSQKIIGNNNIQAGGHIVLDRRGKSDKETRKCDKK